MTDARDRQNALFQQIFGHVPVMICLIGADGEVKLVNREWERTLGWFTGAATVNPVEEFCPGARVLSRVLESIREKAGRVDLGEQAHDGRVIDTSWTVVRLADGACLCIGQDISERKRIEERLSASETQLAQSQRHAHIGTWYWDNRTNALQWSAETYSIFGVAPEKGNPTPDIFLATVHPDDISALHKTIANFLRVRKPGKHDLR